MGTSSLYDWSTTAANNASITGSSINWSENQAPSTINNSAREEMREVALWRDLLGGAKIATGTNTLALTTGLTLAAYAQGMMFAFENTTQNTGAVTINVDTIGAKDIKKFHDVALASGDLEAAGIYVIAYEATAGNFQLLSPVANAPFSDPLTTRGDVIIRGASATSRLAIGSANTVLKTDGTDPSWGPIETANIADDAVTTEKIVDDAGTTAKIVDDAVTLAKMASGTDGTVLTYDASGNPTAVGPGSDGQVLTSTGAGSPPAFEAASGGAWTLIGTAVASSSASLTITGLDSTYDTYAIAIADMVPATDSVQLRMRMGDSGGIDSGSTDYSWAVSGARISGPGTGATGANFTSQDNQEAFMVIIEDCAVGLTSDIWSASAEGCGAMIFLHRPGDGTTQPTISGTGTYWSSDAAVNLYAQTMAGGRRAVITLDRIECLFSSGNIATGRLTIWGIAHA